MTGPELKVSLGLEEYTNCYIQKVLGVGVNLYLVTINTRFPEKHIPTKLLRNNLTTQQFRITNTGLDKLKLTPGVEVEGFSGTLAPNSFIVVRDLGAEAFLKIVKNNKEGLPV